MSQPMKPVRRLHFSRACQFIMKRISVNFKVTPLVGHLTKNHQCIFQQRTVLVHKKCIYLPFKGFRQDLNSFPRKVHPIPAVEVVMPEKEVPAVYKGPTIVFAMKCQLAIQCNNPGIEGVA
ncbi:hypothetical protein GWK47_040676 [Chionoecetes opilio]|uniref:Uncharacterized protein n=1 Tax=Chionoecetes opilio TaxID=41210 RepID=A0A8J4YC02_CHIOP|nr:hypothetical protein GWK47_040676 [Chionoecetes opilio]